MSHYKRHEFNSNVLLLLAPISMGFAASVAMDFKVLSIILFIAQAIALMTVCVVNSNVTHKISNVDASSFKIRINHSDEVEFEDFDGTIVMLASKELMAKSINTDALKEIYELSRQMDEKEAKQSLGFNKGK